MHLSACWIWLISSISIFSLVKLVVTFLFLAIYPRTILISVQIYPVNSFISQSLLIKADIFTSKTAVTSSNREMETNILGVTFALAIINVLYRYFTPSILWFSGMVISTSLLLLIDFVKLSPLVLHIF